MKADRLLAAVAALGASTALALPRPLAAQPDVVSIRLVPRPDQTIHVPITQAYDTTTVPPVPGRDPIVDHGELASAYSETVRASSNEREYSLRVTFEDAPDALRSLVGTPFDAVFDERGRVESLTLPPALASRTDGMKFLVAAFMTENWLQGWPPSVTLSVGGSASVPSAIQLSMPGAENGVGISGGRTLKLVSVGQDGPDRIATLQQTVEASMSGPMTGGASPSIDVSGTGTIEWNVDRGYARRIDLEIALDGTGPNGRTRGTERVHVTAAN